MKKNLISSNLTTHTQLSTNKLCIDNNISRKMRSGHQSSLGKKQREGDASQLPADNKASKSRDPDFVLKLREIYRLLHKHIL